MGFKKTRQGEVTKVQDFVMPSFTLKKKQVTVISNIRTSSFDLLSQLSSIMDQKIADSYKSTNDLLVKLTNKLQTIKKCKSVDDNCSSQQTLVHRL